LPKRLPAVPLHSLDHGFRLKLQRLVSTALKLLVEKLGEDLVCVTRHSLHFFAPPYAVVGRYSLTSGDIARGRPLLLPRLGKSISFRSMPRREAIILPWLTSGEAMPRSHADTACLVTPR